MGTLSLVVVVVILAGRALDWYVYGTNGSLSCFLLALRQDQGNDWAVGFCVLRTTSRVWGATNCREKRGREDEMGKGQCLRENVPR